MRVIVDILHPAHVHVFKHFAREMEAAGHDVLITARDKGGSVELLRAEGFDPVVLSVHRPGRARLAWELLVRSARFWRVARRFRPDLLIGEMGPTIAPVGKLAGWPVVVVYDTEIATVTNRWVYPMATYVVTPDCYLDEVGPNHVTYPGYQETAHLLPARFTPDPDKVRSAGLEPGSGYVFFRFVAFDSSHDTDQTGLAPARREELVAEVARDREVVVSSEAPLPAGIERYAYRGALADVHHALAFADLFVGESATMASEAAVLGTHAVYLASSDRGYIRDLRDRYGLVDVFGEGEYGPFRERVLGLLARQDLAEDATARRERLLEEKIDLTDFLVGFVEEEFGGEAV